MLERFPLLTILLMVFGVIVLAAALMWVAVVLNVLWAIGLFILVVIVGFWLAEHRPSFMRRH